MKFVDQVKIKVTAGNGGDGCIHFRREKFEPKGGPDGGNGGNGGNIWIKIDHNLNTLVDYQFKKNIIANHGQVGQVNNKSGKNGSDIIIKVPIGTRIINYETKEIITDLNNINTQILIAKGGKKGIGNTKFKSSINRTPYQNTKGKKGEQLYIQLELMLIADVGIIGLPNSGKSTLIQAISNAKPKIGLYPFTTIIPTLGTVKLKNNKTFIVADIPGLIQGASHGIGLGIKFLKHIERCYILLHLVDISQKIENILNNIHIIQIELKKYSKYLYNKPTWLIFNKIDYNNENIIKKKITYIINKIKICKNFYYISAMKNIGTEKLCYQIVNFLEKKKSFLF
ncbi:Obg family GTPase CgtA [Buchnera aphidicola]|uniref:Obg family GTPase CgtA n=1 Tax=Buchnera aphidicola TaxID=9 RepID=UPI003463B410